MTMDEAEQLMKPFFPNDVYLAGKALSRSMAEREGVLLPDWMCEAVVQQYFTYAFMQQMTRKQEFLFDRLSAEDPFKMETVPLPFIDKPCLN